LRDLDVDGNVALNSVLKKEVARLWTGLNLLDTGSVAVSYEQVMNLRVTKKAEGFMTG
jgi:hypothetical protein